MRSQGRALAAIGWIALAGCAKPAFPDGFLFGTAIAGFQAEGGCLTLPAEQCEDRGSDWYQFITSREIIEANEYMSGHPPSAMPGHWELYAQDFALASKELHNDALRTSLEWSRIFPNPTDGAETHEALLAIADPAALAHYREMLASMRAEGLTPLVTLNHYTLPLWIHDGAACHADLSSCTRRGWLDRERIVREIAKYAGFVARELGAEVDLWATLNEPFAVVLPGYMMPSKERANPPAVLLRYAAAKAVIIAMIEAHARMYDAVKAADQADADGDGQASKVGLVYAVAPTRPKDPSSRVDQNAAKNLYYLFNAAFLNGAIRGDVDPELDGTSEHREDLAGRMDYLGINYYTRVTVEGLPDPAFPAFSPLSNINLFTTQLWEDYPRGIYEVAMLSKEYGLPVIITENGTADPNDDGTGPSFLVRHLEWLKRAIRDGADVRGYFYWTLFDNYEWNHGMGVRMGLFAVDKDDPQKQRRPRQASAAYSRIARLRDIPQDLGELYPAGE